jgi:putative pyrroloquinoline-quinone binding quinoprotein
MRPSHTLLRRSKGRVVAAALVVAASGLSTSAVAATPGSALWAKRYDGPSNIDDRANAVAVSPDGSMVFVTGYISSAFTGYDWGTVAYDASTGVVRWTKRYNGPAFETLDTIFVSQANAIAVSPDGSTVFVTGSSYSPGLDYATVAYDASTGTTLWAKRFNGPANGHDEAYALGVSPDGAKVFVTGYSEGSGGILELDPDYVTIAYAASTGTRSWTARFEAANQDDIATTLAVSPDGSSVFVSGYSQTPSTSYDYATVSYDTGNGEQRWIKRYNDPIDSADQARSVGVSPDGSTVFVTGYSSTATTQLDYTTIAYDASTGAKLWLKLYDGPGSATDLANALAVSPDGSLAFVTGQDFSSATGYDYATIAYDASTGVRVWAKRYAGTASLADAANDIGVGPDGATVIVTGFRGSSTTAADYATIAYDASTGARLWAERYDGPASDGDVATALDVSASAVFVTGYSYRRPSREDYATIAYALA